MKVYTQQATKKTTGRLFAGTRRAALRNASGATIRRARAARLGNITESAAALSAQAYDLSLPPSELELKRVNRRRVNYALQAVAGRLLGRSHRVFSCCRVPSYHVQNGNASRGISKDAEGRAFFHGVGHCGSAWECPICSVKLAECRRSEVLSALKAHRDSGGVAVLVTFTFAHSRNDELKPMIKAFMRALSKLKGTRAFKRVKEEIGYIGQIRALEVRHSDVNGWHPHTHEVWFLDRSDLTGADLSRVRAAVFAEWRKVCLRCGLGEPNEEHGVDIQYREADGADAVGSYVTKWGSELTYGQSKLGRKGSRSAWQILEDCAMEYSPRDHALFREYAESFKGRAMLYWSPGLKARFQIEEISDTEAADRPEAVLVVDLTDKQWSTIVKTRAHARVLEYAEFSTASEVLAYIDRLQLGLNQLDLERYRLKRWVAESSKRIMADLGILN